MRLCRNCGDEFAHHSKKRYTRCGPCRYHWEMYGEERSLDPALPPEPKVCLNCGVSIEVGHHGYNRCNACHMYKYRRGHERPRHLYTRFAAWAHAHPGETP